MAQQLRGQDFIVDTDIPQINPNNIRTMKKDLSLSKGFVQPQKPFVATPPPEQSPKQTAPSTPKTISMEPQAPASAPPQTQIPKITPPQTPTTQGGEFKIFTGAQTIKSAPATAAPAQTAPAQEQPLKPSKPTKVKEGDVVILEAWEVGSGSGGINNYHEGSPEIPNSDTPKKNGEMKTIKINLGLKDNPNIQPPAQSAPTAPTTSAAIPASKPQAPFMSAPTAAPTLQTLKPQENIIQTPVAPDTNKPAAAKPQPVVNQIKPETPKPQAPAAPVAPAIVQAKPDTPKPQIKIEIPKPQPKVEVVLDKSKEEEKKKEEILGFNPEIQLMIKKGAAPVKPVEKKVIILGTNKLEAKQTLPEIPPDMIPPLPPSIVASKMASTSQETPESLRKPEGERKRPALSDEIEPQEMPGYEWIEPVDIPGKKKTQPPKDKFTEKIEKALKAGKQAFADLSKDKHHKPEIKPQPQHVKPQTPQPTTKPREEVQTQPVIEQPKDARAQLRDSLANIGRQKSLLSTERDAILKNIDLQAKEARSSSQSLQSAITELLKKKESLESTLLADSMRNEASIEADLRAIIANQKNAKGLLQEEELERKREEKEMERKLAERTRWEIEDKILKILDQIEANKLQYQAMLGQEERLREKKLDILHREETIELEEQKIRCELDLLDLESKQKDLSSRYSSLLPLKNITSKALRELSDEKLSIDQELNSLESKEKEAEGADKRKIEELRQSLEAKRKAQAQAYLQKVKEKDKIDKDVSEVSQAVQELATKEQSLKERIASYERQIKSKRKIK